MQRTSIILALIVLLPNINWAASLTVDLTREVGPPTDTPIGAGACKNPQGHEITADSRSFFLNGKPWIPVVGEFHYARYPQAEWRDELLKMKAGGISVVSTYVFWIHHEEERGRFDWSGQRSLRDFLKLCQAAGLKAVVRMGPWCHGEVRNGGFPDWVQNSHTRLRTLDPEFLKLVEPFYKEEANQMQGLLWKDGGPVIGIQVDNECGNPAYLLALKQMALADGVDVPLYTMTGWNGVNIPKEGLLPVFGAYSIGFWGGGLEDYRKFFVFSNIRDNGDMGAQFQNIRSARNENFEKFPYACAEIGGGMTSSYNRRIKINPSDVAAMALVKLGCGSNMPGYYMYQGGINPDGKLSYLNEERPSPLPFKDYDFQTALGACGEVREQYHVLRQQHLFLQDFGPMLARMPVFFPDQKPADLKDFSLLRWDVRSDGKSGFLFFSNHQPAVPLPEHRDVQFELKTSTGPLLVPRQPVTIPTGSYGVWPVNLDCNGVTLEYATAQPLCRITTEGGDTVYFFTALEGIPPELAMRADDKLHFSADQGVREESGGTIRIHSLKQGTTPAVTVVKADGHKVAFVVLDPGQGRRLWRTTFAGWERVVLSDATVLEDGACLRLQADDPNKLSISMFPPVPGSQFGDVKVAAGEDGIFARLAPNGKRPASALDITATLENPAGPKAASLKGMDEATWKDAAVYKLNIPPEAAGRRLILKFHYTGDAARFYVGETFCYDNFYNGDPFDVALWRIPSAEWTAVRLKILPYSEALMRRLPDEAKTRVNQAKAGSALEKVTVTVDESISLQITPL